MTTITGAHRASSPGQDENHVPVEAEDRGALRIADRVVQRVAGYAVTLVPYASAGPQRVLGITVGQPDADDHANVRAQVHGGLANVHATIAVQWPASVRDVAEQVRRRVRDDVTQMTGVKVDHIHINVVSLAAASARPPRVR